MNPRHHLLDDSLIPCAEIGGPLSRRGLIGGFVKAALGVTLFDRLSGELAAAEIARKPGDTKGGVNLIILSMRGAMSHLDTFDPKPDAAGQGETKAIQTKTPGVFFGEHLPTLAALSDRLAVVRSMTTETGAHEQGTYLMRTSYQEIASIRHPSLGSWAVHAAGRRSRDLPGFVLVGNGNEHPGCGFLDPSLTPVPVADPDKGLENIRRPRYLSEKNFERRLALADRIDRDFRRRFAGPQVEAYDRMYEDAVRLLGSEELTAFDISQESETVKARYGDTTFARGCLLARRLVESGVRCIEVELGGWDMHREIFEDLPEKAADLDRGMGALINDLEERGLLASTLVVLATEFGRTPAINENAGRDHHPAVFSCVLAGAGVKGGIVHGASDSQGRLPDRDAVSVADFNTTIAAAAGLPYEKEFTAPNGRPFKIGGGGKPIAAILS